MAKLGDICVKIDNIDSTYDDMIEYIDISSVDNIKKKIISTQTLDYSEAPSRAKQLIQNGDILVSNVRPNLNAVALVDTETDKTLVASTGYTVIRCNNTAYNKYVFFFCQYSGFVDLLSQQATGASYPAVNAGIIKNTPIPLPPLSTQRQIAATLDKVTHTIDLCNAILEKLDLLVKSRFVEMFGEPVTNPMIHTKHTLMEICNKITDGTHDTPKRYDSGYLLITGKNIRANEIIFDQIEYVSEEDHKTIYARCNPEYEDILYTNIGVNYGTAVLNTLRYEFSMKNVALLKPNRAIVNSYYLWKVLNYMRDYILEINQVGGAQSFMGLATIKKISIPVPPLDLQQQFAAFVEQTNKSKLAVKQVLEKAETLKKALMQEYFG